MFSNTGILALAESEGLFHDPIWGGINDKISCDASHLVFFIIRHTQTWFGEPDNKKSLCSSNTGILALAESEGFEPSIRFPVYTLSRRALSTTQTALRLAIYQGIAVC